MFFGLIILIVGVLIILQYLGIITGDVWTIFWGSVLIAFGLLMMTKKSGASSCAYWPFASKKK